MDFPAVGMAGFEPWTTVFNDLQRPFFLTFLCFNVFSFPRSYASTSLLFNVPSPHSPFPIFTPRWPKVILRGPNNYLGKSDHKNYTGLLFPGGGAGEFAFVVCRLDASQTCLKYCRKYVANSVPNSCAPGPQRGHTFQPRVLPGVQINPQENPAPQRGATS